MEHLGSKKCKSDSTNVATSATLNPHFDKIVSSKKQL